MSLLLKRICNNVNYGVNTKTISFSSFLYLDIGDVNLDVTSQSHSAGRIDVMKEISLEDKV